MTRRLLVAAALAVAATALAAPAYADWTGPLPVPGSASAVSTALAVNGRGDVGVAWAQEGHAGSGHNRHVTVVVRASVRAAGETQSSTRTLLSARDRAVQGVTITLDRRGEATVAWIDTRKTGDRLPGARTVRAAFRCACGRWSLVQAIGRSAAFFGASPQLAAAPDGSVALTYNAGVSGAPGLAAAWRSRGHRFGRVHAVPGGRVRLTEPTLAFDRAGTAYLAGIRDCSRAPSRGFLYTAGARSRRFGAGRVIAPAPARDLRLAVTGRGSAVAAWLSGTCNAGEDLSGTPTAAALHGGAITSPVRLDRAPAAGIVLAGAEASWIAHPGAPDTGVLTAAITAGGAAQPARAPADGWVAVAADSGGNRLLRQIRIPDTGISSPLAASPAGGAPIEPAPVAASGWPWTDGTAAAADGSALAALTSTDRGLVTAVWRPHHA